MLDIIILIHNIRSSYNVGSILRTAEGFGVSKVIFSGYTPYPKLIKDDRLPHIANKLTKQIHKTALGAEFMINLEFQSSPDFHKLRQDNYRIVGLEQDSRSISLADYSINKKIALVIGEEVNGIEDEIRIQCDDIIEIAMYGKKESFNVRVATGIALYALTTAK